VWWVFLPTASEYSCPIDLTHLTLLNTVFFRYCIIITFI
jgi:hypothetical protein